MNTHNINKYNKICIIKYISKQILNQFLSFNKD